MGGPERGKEQSMDDILASIRKIISTDAGSGGGMRLDGRGEVLRDPPESTQPLSAPSAVSARREPVLGSGARLDVDDVDELAEFLEPVAMPAAPQNRTQEEVTGRSSGHGPPQASAGSTWGQGSLAHPGEAMRADPAWTYEGDGQQPYDLPRAHVAMNGVGDVVQPELSLQGKLAAVEAARGEKASSIEALFDNGQADKAQLSTPQAGAQPLASDRERSVLDRLVDDLPHHGPNDPDDKRHWGANDAADRGDAQLVTTPVTDQRTAAMSLEVPATGKGINSGEVRSATEAANEGIDAASQVGAKGAAAGFAQGADADAKTAEPAVGKTSGGSDGKTVEALVLEALRPMLREWLDDNLPRLVEKEMAAERLRIAGAAVGKD